MVYFDVIESHGTLVGCFGFNGPLRQYFSLYRVDSQREGERGERIDERKMSKPPPPPPAPTASAVGPCPTVIQTVGRPGTGSLPSTVASPDHPRHGTSHGSMLLLVFGWLVVLGFNGPLRQYFSLYRAVSQREGERGEKR